MEYNKVTTSFGLFKQNKHVSEHQKATQTDENVRNMKHISS